MEYRAALRQPGIVLDISPCDYDHAVLAEILNRSQWSVAASRNCSEAIAFLKRKLVAVVVCERDLPDGNWRKILERTAAAANPPAVIVVSTFADDRLWSEVLDCGGYDVLRKPLHPEELLREVSFAWRYWHDRQQRATRRTSGAAG